MVLLILRTLCRINGKNNHQSCQFISLVVIFDNEGVGPVELSRCRDNRMTISICHFIIPVEKVALNSPVFEIKGENRPQECEFLADTAHFLAVDYDFEARQESENLLSYRAYMHAVGIVNVQLMSPGKLALDGVNRLAMLVVNVITVKPGKKPLLK